MIIKKQKLYQNDILSLSPTIMSFAFTKPRTVLSTGEFNGGIVKCDGVFNQKLSKKVVTSKDLPGESVAAYLASIAKEQGFTSATGLLTIAAMERYGYSFIKNDDIIIEVFATAGVNGNAARAGEKPLYKETKEGFQKLGGTINIFAFLSLSLCPGMLTRALITLTEAKSALLSELGVFSSFGKYTATGTGTDGIIVAMNDYGTRYNDVGTHSQLGYLMAKATKEALKEALLKESFWSSYAQISAKRILSRRAKSINQQEMLFMRFSKLSFDEKEQVLEGLSIFNLLEEKKAWGALPERVIDWLYQETIKRYPLLHEW